MRMDPAHKCKRGAESKERVAVPEGPTQPCRERHATKAMISKALKKQGLQGACARTRISNGISG